MERRVNGQPTGSERSAQRGAALDANIAFYRAHRAGGEQKLTLVETPDNILQFPVVDQGQPNIFDRGVAWISGTRLGRPVTGAIGTAVTAAALVACGSNGNQEVDVTATQRASLATPTLAPEPTPTQRVIVIQVPTPTPTATPTEVLPTPTPKVIKDIFAIEVMDSSIASVKSRADAFYAAHPEAHNWRLSYTASDVTRRKSSLDNALRGCEHGSPDAVSEKDQRIMRESTCKAAIFFLLDFYFQHPDMPELAQMVVDTRAYLIAQYPDTQEGIDASIQGFLNKLSIK